MKIGRRQSVLGLGALTFAALAPRWLSLSSLANDQLADTVIDFHVHLFGIGDENTGCRLSAKQRRHVNYRYLLKLLGLSENGRLDRDYVERLVAQLRASSVRRAVLQSWDCRYDESGRPDWERTTSLYVPSSYLFDVVKEFPDLFIPCASLNPKRRDWRDELDRCVELGARVVKVHPPTMDVDPGDPRFRPFFRRCAEQRMIVMVHTGAEHSADIVGLDYCDPQRLVPALEEGCTVIAAHLGMSAFFDREDFFPNFLPLARRFRNLYYDTAVLASMFRWRNLPRLLEEPELWARGVHGSDFPFPSNALVFWNRIGPWEMGHLLTERNLIERDYQIKRSLGLPREIFERGARLLAEADPRKS
jgi:predicted TIM-barrel fold metal-dependent hydrolase